MGAPEYLSSQAITILNYLLDKIEEDEYTKLSKNKKSYTKGFLLKNITSEDLVEIIEKLNENIYTVSKKDLDNGNIDAVILDNPVAESFAKDEDRKVEYVIQTDEYFGFGVSEGNAELQNGLNEQLELFMESDDWTALLEKYFE